MADRIGQQLGNYRLVRLLGRGGFAEVYLGEHVELGTQAAIKVLHAQLSSKDVERFNAEASTIARLSHPHIVRLLEFATDEGTPFLVLDYAPGGTLRERHPRGMPLPVEMILPYVQQACDALQYAHDKKLIHRDVKPENLLLAAGGQVLLGDFGIATVAQSSHSQSTQEALGTITYMAPEQIQGKPRPASDLYALGVIVYEWLTGEPPFSGSFGEIATQHLFASPQPLRERVPEIPEAVEYVVLMALAKDPHERFANVQALATALEEAAQGKSPLLFAPTQITPPTSADAPTLPGALNGPSLETTRRASRPPVTSPTAPELPPTFSTPPGLAATPAQPSGPTGAKARRNVVRNALIVVLALLLIGVSGVALALSHSSFLSGSGVTQGGNNGAPTSSGGSSSNPIAIGSATPTASNGAPTRGATNTPPPGATATPTDTPSTAPTDTPTPTDTPGPVLPTTLTMSESDTVAGPGTTITLRAQVNRPLDNTGYQLIISGSPGVVADCSAGTTCSGQITDPSPSSCPMQTYGAYVARSPNSSAILTTPVVTIQWMKPTLYFKPYNPQPPFKVGTQVVVSAIVCSLGAGIRLGGTGYTLYLVDVTTGQVLNTTNDFQVDAGETSSTPTSHTFVAYIAKNYPSGISGQSPPFVVTWT